VHQSSVFFNSFGSPPRSWSKPKLCFCGGGGENAAILPPFSMNSNQILLSPAETNCTFALSLSLLGGFSSMLLAVKLSKDRKIDVFTREVVEQL
jgi:hypothetical protein